MKGPDASTWTGDRLEAPRTVLWPYAALALVILGLGAVVAAWTLERRLDARRAELVTIARLKASQADSWFTERRASAGLAGTGFSQAQLYRAWQEQGDETAAQSLFTRLRQFAEAGRFDHVALYGPSGRPLWRSDPSTPIVEVVGPDDARPAFGAAARQGAPYLGAAGDLNVDFVVPLPVEPPGTAPRVAYTVGASELMSDALRDWPTPTRSGSVVLVHASERELWAVAAGAGTSELRTLHFGADDARPASLHSTLPGSIEAGGAPSLLDGLDHRGVYSYAAVVPLAVPGWALVAKLDRSDVLQRELVPIVTLGSVLVAALIAAGWLGLTVVRQRQRRVLEHERDRLERRYLRRLRLLDAIAEASTDAIYAKSADGRYLFANPATHDLLGLDRDTLVGKTEYDVFDEAHANRLRAIDRRVLEHDHVAPFEDHVDTPLGHRVFRVIKGKLLDRDGAPLGVFGISRDVTEQHEAERTSTEQRRALEASVAELERFNRVLVDREVRMVELKREVNELRARLELPPLHSLRGLDTASGGDDA